MPRLFPGIPGRTLHQDKEGAETGKKLPDCRGIQGHAGGYRHFQEEWILPLPSDQCDVRYCGKGRRGRPDEPAGFFVWERKLRHYIWQRIKIQEGIPDEALCQACAGLHVPFGQDAGAAFSEPLRRQNVRFWD